MCSVPTRFCVGLSDVRVTVPPCVESFNMKGLARELEAKECGMRAIHLHFPTAGIAGTKMPSSRVLLHSLALCLSQALYRSNRHCFDTHTQKRDVEWRSCNFTSVTKNVVRQTARLHNSCASLERVSRVRRVSSTATIGARSCTKGIVLSAHAGAMQIDCAAIALCSNECLYDPLDCPPLVDQSPPLPRDEYEPAP